MSIENRPSFWKRVGASISALAIVFGGAFTAVDKVNDVYEKCDGHYGALYDEIIENPDRSRESLQGEYRHRDRICEDWTFNEVYNQAQMDVKQ